MQGVPAVQMTVWREKNTNAKFNFQLLLTESCYMTSNLIQAFAFGIWQKIFLKNTASSEEEWTSVILNAIPQSSQQKCVSVRIYAC